MRLQRSEARFRNVIERNADAIVVVDSVGMIRFVNHAAEVLFGKAREVLLLHPFGFPLVSGETTELELPADGGSARVVEMRVVESDWEERPAYLASLRDVTERKQAEEAAQRLMRERVARASAEEAAQRMRFLANSLTRLTSHLEYRDALAELAAVCVRQFADWAVVYGVDSEGAVMRLEVACRDPAQRALADRLRQHRQDLDATHPVHEVLQTRRSLLVSEVSSALWQGVSPPPAYVEWIRQLGVTSFAIVPMIARDRAVGALSIASCDPERPLDPDVLTLVEDLAHRSALALDNAWLYERAQNAIRAQTDLVAMISHDLRTPLASMLGYAELLSLGIPERVGSGALKQVERIQSSGRHLLYLIEQLTEFARLDADKSDMRMQEVDGSQMLREVGDLMEPLAMERGLLFRLEGEDSLGTLVTDPGKLRQVLVNLVGNAIKYTEQGSVAVQVAHTGGEVSIDVRDTGVGIDARHLEQIFLPFWQAPQHSDGPGGAGLGLSIVKGLVSRLGGRVSVQSVPGRGSTFTLVLPRRRAG